MITRHNSTLTLTDVLRYINMRLGVSVQELELDEEDIMNIITQQTIPIWSSYFPFMPLVRITTKDLIPGTSNEYFIPNEQNLNIFGVHKLYQNNNFYYGYSGHSSSFIPYTDPIYAQLSADRASATILPTLYDYIPPNRIRIRDNGMIHPMCDYLVQVKATQPNHLQGINFGYKDIFCELAYADVLTALYPIRNRFSQFNTAYGQVSAFTEEINNHQNIRDNVIQKLETQYLNSGEIKKIYIF